MKARDCVRSQTAPAGRTTRSTTQTRTRTWDGASNTALPHITATATATRSAWISAARASSTTTGAIAVASETPPLPAWAATISTPGLEVARRTALVAATKATAITTEQIRLAPSAAPARTRVIRHRHRRRRRRRRRNRNRNRRNRNRNRNRRHSSHRHHRRPRLLTRHAHNILALCGVMLSPACTSTSSRRSLTSARAIASPLTTLASRMSGTTGTPASRMSGAPRKRTRTARAESG